MVYVDMLMGGAHCLHCLHVWTLKALLIYSC